VSAERQQRFGQYLVALQNAADVVDLHGRRVAEVQAIAFEKFAKAEDDAFMADLPEAKDSAALNRLQDATVRALEEDYGLSHKEIVRRWNSDGPDSFRPRMVQRALADLGRAKHYISYFPIKYIGGDAA
jgi:hypothetical protein